MNRRRTCALAAIAALLGALSLTSCSTPAHGFRILGVEPTTSRAFPGELQLFSGSYTFAANDVGDALDLHWSVTYGRSATDPFATPVTTVDGSATMQVDFSAPDDAKRFYRICLSSIAEPATPPTCQIIAVGGNSLWFGMWAEQNLLTGMVAAQNGHEVAIVLLTRYPAPPIRGTLTSPFVFTEVQPDGTELWIEWTSPTTMQWHDTGDFTFVKNPNYTGPLP